MNQSEIIKLVKRELARPTLGVVKQFLEIHEIDQNGGEPAVVRIHHNTKEKTVSVYLAVKNEKFYFVVLIDLKSKKIDWAYDETYSKVYLAAYSRSLSPEKMQKLTKLLASETLKKGDAIHKGKLKRKENTLIFKLPSVPEDFESHLSKFIEFLEKDPKGIKKLSTKTDVWLRVMIVFHNGNGMLGGFSISSDIINRLSKLGIKIDFDLYAAGRQFL